MEDQADYRFCSETPFPYERSIIELMPDQPRFMGCHFGVSRRTHGTSVEEYVLVVYDRITYPYFMVEFKRNDSRDTVEPGRGDHHGSTIDGGQAFPFPDPIYVEVLCCAAFDGL